MAEILFKEILILDSNAVQLTLISGKNEVSVVTVSYMSVKSSADIVIDDVKTTRPKDKPNSIHRAIRIVREGVGRFTGKTGKGLSIKAKNSYSFNYSDLDSSSIQILISDILKAAEPA
jgi:hypothetical protein